MPADDQSLNHQLREKAREIGFEECRVTSADAIPDAAKRLSTFLENGYHGDMDWMEAHADRRASPKALWPNTKSVIMLAMNYGPAADPLGALENTSNATISVYARGKDYHDIVKKKLKQLAGWFVEQTGAEVKVFVDTAPVQEKPLGAAAGLGWQGKHTNLVSRNLGSWFFIGSIFTDHALPADPAEQDHCGSCNDCHDICPTRAFPAPYQLDARRCISYLTIEHKGHIPSEFRRPMGNRIYGCDDCLAVCPWNKFAETAAETRFHPRVETDNPPLAQLLTLDDAAFRSQFAGTPIKRTGRNRFLRNTLIAAGNSGDETLTPLVRKLTQDPSPFVRAMAAWALSRLVDQAEFMTLATERLAEEKDADVIAEWRNGQN